jgi:hypothetical protein
MRQIPRVPPTDNPERRGFDEATKERLEVIAGLRGVKIALLDPATATLEDCVNKINAVVDLLQQ